MRFPALDLGATGWATNTAADPIVRDQVDDKNRPVSRIGGAVRGAKPLRPIRYHLGRSSKVGQRGAGIGLWASGLPVLRLWRPESLRTTLDCVGRER